MDASQVAELLDAFGRHRLRAWVAGGWAVDALVGRQTRTHGDLDLAVDAGQLDALMVLLDELGFAVTVDWLPSRVELTAADGRRVDLHPVRFATDGSGVQPGLDGGLFHYPAGCFSSGVVNGRTVGCLGVDLQLAFRQGYEPRDVDHHDLALLHALRHDTDSKVE